MADPTTPRRGLLIDYGGVLTSDLFAGFAAFSAQEGLEPDALKHAFASDRDARRLLVDFECGRVDAAAFEPALAGYLGLADHADLVRRIFAHVRPEPAMLDAVLALRAAGIRTGLLSNSWGEGGYDRSRFAELFDVLVISGEEGVRKPSTELYVLAAERIGLPSEELVFVDDLEQNLRPALELGMASVHHQDPAATLAQLEALFEVPLVGRVQA